MRRDERMAEGGQKQSSDKGMVEDASGQTAGSYTVLRGERKLPTREEVLQNNCNAGQEMAQQTKPEKEDELGKIQQVFKEVSIAPAKNSTQFLYIGTCMVS